MSVIKVPTAKAAEFRERLRQLLDDLAQAESDTDPGDPDTVTVDVLLGYFSPTEEN